MYYGFILSIGIATHVYSYYIHISRYIDTFRLCRNTYTYVHAHILISYVYVYNNFRRFLTFMQCSAFNDDHYI